MMGKRYQTGMLYFVFLLLYALPLFSQWKTGPAMPHPRAGAAAVVWNDAVYLFGGKTSGDSILNTVAKFDLNTFEWVESDIPPFKMARYNATAIVYHNEIYLIGGADARNRSLRHVEIYSPVQKKWRHAQSLRKERNGAFAVILNNQLFVMGGSENGWYDYPDDIEWLDTNKNEWKKAEGELDEGIAAPFYGIRNDTIFIFGGYYIQPIAHAKMGYLDSDDEFHWEDLPPLNAPRAYGASVQYGDSLFLIGGVDQSGLGVATVTIFNFRTKSYTPGPALQIARSGAVGAVGKNRIFVFGGYNANNNEILSSVEYFGETITAIEAPQPPVTLPSTFVHITGYPNPFNGIAHLQVVVQQRADVELSIYDLHGRLIKNIFRGQLTAGNHQFAWNGNDNSEQPVASGMYLAIVRAGNHKSLFKLLYIK